MAPVYDKSWVILFSGFIERRTGLFGVHNAIALVFAVISAAQSSAEGKKPLSQHVFSGIGTMPSIRRVVLLRLHQHSAYCVRRLYVLMSKIASGSASENGMKQVM